MKMKGRRVPEDSGTKHSDFLKITEKNGRLYLTAKRIGRHSGSKEEFEITNLFKSKNGVIDFEWELFHMKVNGTIERMDGAYD